MSNYDGIGQQQQFVEEINYEEIEIEEIVGKGSFGVVWKGKWRDRYVAVKHINTENERKAFAVEVRQLSRVVHPNIVKLYGACTKNPVCLIMEYAEGGSLYNVLHSEDNLPEYTAAHAMSWALQCAQGVAYLHNMKPKPLIHRDLKPPNLLLILGGQTLKICDFGTACDLNTYMTNNKGSAAWMAPEVFEGSRYTEKCDVFSWGIILWEIFSRKKPFDDIGGSAYRIMWAVHVGQRPPLLDGCPKPLEDLMTRCWKKIPEERPSMDEVVSIMTSLSEFFRGPLDPIEYSISTEGNGHQNLNDTLDMPSILNSQLSTSLNSAQQLSSYSNSKKQLNMNYTTKCETPVCESSVKSPVSLANIETAIPANKKIQNNNILLQQNVNSPASECTSNVTKSTQSQPSLPQNPNLTSLHVECDPNAWELEDSNTSWELHTMAGFDKMFPKAKKTVPCSTTTNEDLDNVCNLLDAELRPLTPDYTCPQSREIFEGHKQLAQEYLRVQTEIALLDQHKNEMVKNLSLDSLRQQQEIRKLNDEKEGLVKLYQNMKLQLEILKGKQGNMVGDSLVSTSALSRNDGWVFVPRQDPSRHS